MPAPAGGVHRPGVSVGLRLGRLPENRRDRRYALAGRAWWSPGPLPEPIFTPSTKAELGTHDENISFEKAAAAIGAELAARVRDVSLTLYRRALAWAEPRGIILADTKFEFGLVDGELLLIDEVLTPDSSRFWPPGRLCPRRPPEELRQAVSPGLPGIPGLEQAAAAAAPARRGPGQHPGQIPGGPEKPDR